MATPPTFVAESEIASWTVSTSPRNVSRAVTAGDRIVVFGVAANDLTDLGTPSDGVNTYSLAQNVDVTDYCNVYVWTATAATTATLTISITRGGSGGDHWGMDVLVFNGSDGFGASNKTNVSSGGPSLSLTTQADNSAIACCSADWNGGVITGRTWRTVNSITPTSGNGLETVAVRDTGTYSIYAAYWNDAGTAGAKTVGLSAPTGQKYAIVAVEIKGAGGATLNADQALSVTDTVATAATVAQAAGAALTETASVATAGTVAQAAAAAVSVTAARATAATVAQAAGAALSTSAAVTSAGTVAQAAAAALSVTTARSTAAAVTEQAAAALAVTAAISTAAALQWSVAAPVTVTAAVSAAATVAQAGASTRPVTATVATAASVTQAAGQATVVTAAITTAATITSPGLNGDVDLAVTVARTTAATVALAAGSSLALDAARSTAAAVAQAAGQASTITVAVTTTATVTSPGAQIDVAVSAARSTSALITALAGSTVSIDAARVTAATVAHNAAAPQVWAAIIATQASIGEKTIRLGVKLDAILDQLVSHAKRSGLYPGGVNTVEPKKAPQGLRLSAAIWSQAIDPVPGESGLSNTTARIEYLHRIYQNMISEPEDAIDPRVLAAAAYMIEAYSGDFQLGGVDSVMAIDLLGMAGSPLSARAGYIPQDGKLFRCYTITIPVLVSDAFPQAA